MTTPTDSLGVFTLADLETYGAIFAGCNDQRPCKWSTDGGDTATKGTMRRLTGYTEGKDVREYEVQISGVGEFFLPITEVARMLRERTFFIR